MRTSDVSALPKRGAAGINHIPLMPRKGMRRKCSVEGQELAMLISKLNLLRGCLPQFMVYQRATYTMLSQALATHERRSNTPWVYPENTAVEANPSRSLLSTESFDTHVHVFDPKLGPYAAGRAYTPEDAPLQKLLALNQSLARDYSNTTLVLVQPSPYKNDCTVMMHCLRELRDRGIRSFGIAVLDLDTITDAQLNEMHALGVRGIRLNFQADGKDVDIIHLISLLNRTADRIRHLPSWAIQLFVPGWTWDREYLSTNNNV